MSAPFRLRALLDGVPDVDLASLPAGALDVEIAEVRDDSREVQAGDLFVAVPGTKVDARQFVPDVAARGARVLVIEGPPPPFPGVVVSVASARRALGVIAANRFGAARALDLIAITGTNGKTTNTYLLEAILLAAGRSPGVIGTVNVRAAAWPAGAREANWTTPAALVLQSHLAEMHAAGTTDVVLEVTSQALEQGRVEGCRFLVAGLTNVTQDHLDYHGTMERYFDAKAILFERLMRDGAGVGVFFVDQDEGRRMRARLRGGRALGVALTPAGAAAAGGGADVVVTGAAQSAQGWRLQVETPIGAMEVLSPLVGDFNLANLALAIGMAIGRGLERDAIVAGLARLGGVPGRLERVPNARGVLCLVDYSHTPDALERAIAAVRPLATGRVVVVFGCGGDRDRSKRPVMGAIAARDADLAIVTSDNPRTEDPGSILDMIVEGVRGQGSPALDAAALADAPRGYHREVDRRVAIRRAAAACRAGDVLLIAGKGHEDYQITGTTKAHFDDREEASAALAAVTASSGSR